MEKKRSKRDGAGGGAGGTLYAATHYPLAASFEIKGCVQLEAYICIGDRVSRSKKERRHEDATRLLLSFPPLASSTSSLIRFRLSLSSFALRTDSTIRVIWIYIYISVVPIFSFQRLTTTFHVARVAGEIFSSSSTYYSYLR